MTENFKDNFSKQSGIYAKYRPHYPKELFEFLSSLTTEHDLAWDCGTGNGQAAIGLTEFYETIIATDPSEQQIKNASLHPKIKYKVERSEESSFTNNSVDLLTIANAIHWFNFDLFYKEVNRVVKNNGIIAAWTNHLPIISPTIDVVVKHYHDITLNDYWQTENRLAEKLYTTIPFPFNEIKHPDFFTEKTMSLHDLIGYLNTWSATQRFINANNFNPTDELFDNILPLWGDPDSDKKITWKLALKVGRVSK